MNNEIVTLVKIIQHINQVAYLLKEMARQIEARADIHDSSKFGLDEFAGIVHLTKARKYEYGSPEYEALVHNNNAAKIHVKTNRHHLEYWSNGLDDMSLVDVIEMLCDWEIARQQRDIETDIDKTWQARQERFNLSDNETSFLMTIWEKLQKDLV